MTQRLAAIALGVLALVATGPASASTPAQKCAATKTKAAGKKAAAKAGCQSKAAQKATAVDPACLMKAETKFSSTYSKAEAKGGCATSGDASPIEAKVDAFVDDLVEELTGSPAGALLTTKAAQTCAGKKLKAAGKKASGKLACDAKAKSKGIAPDPGCLSKADTKFQKAWTSAEAKGGCATTGDQAAIEAKVDAFVDDASSELPAASTTTTTTSTTTTSTTTTTLPLNSCCAAERVHTLSTGHCSATTSQTCTDDSGCPGGESCVSDGVLAVSTLPAFPFPLGVTTFLDVAPADGFPSCKHDVIIPPGGFQVPVFCIPALQFTSQVQYTGCQIGSAEGKGRLWDGAAACADADISKVGDTSDGVCNPPGQLCTTAPGGAGANTLGDIDSSRGDGVCDAAGMNLQIDLPATSLTWVAADASCPDSDGVFNPGTDTPVTQFSFILSPTTATASATYVDTNGDGCKRAGNGPDQNKVCSNAPTKPCGAAADCPSGGSCVAGLLHGSPAPGPCCVVGQDNVIGAAGIAFTGGAPLYDIVFASSIPNRVVSCDAWPGPGSCTLTTDDCLGSPSGAFVDPGVLF